MSKVKELWRSDLGTFFLACCLGVGIILFSHLGNKLRELEAKSALQVALTDNCKKNHIIMVSASWCHYCRTATRELGELGVKFLENQIDRLPLEEQKEIARQLQPYGFVGYPFFIVRNHETNQFSYVSGWQKAQVVQQYCN